MKPIFAIGTMTALLAAVPAHAVPFHVMFETDADVPSGLNELALLSYASVDDIVTDTRIDNVFTDLGVAAGFSTTGIAYDGSLFHVMFETDEDVVSGLNELAILSYASLDDIVTDTRVSTVFTDLGVAAGFSTTGIAYDGAVYYVMFETDEDVVSGLNELAVLSYASIADIVSDTRIDTVFTDLGVAAGFSTTGFSYDGSLFHVMFETDEDVVSGLNELAVLSYASIADIVSDTRVSSVFTNLGVAAGFSTTGLVYEGRKLASVPEPSTLGLLLAGMLGVARVRRRRITAVR